MHELREVLEIALREHLLSKGKIEKFDLKSIDRIFFIENDIPEIKGSLLYSGDSFDLTYKGAIRANIMSLSNNQDSDIFSHSFKVNDAKLKYNRELGQFEILDFGYFYITSLRNQI